ncbi:hypothetical protein HZA96_03080 [Candidatus Woesearchaeota archaeon]|nr:hypothetical protein [Candidatus Woesearchaeota archaeon]
MARISTMYDLLNGIIFSSSLGPHKLHEFDLGIELIQEKNSVTKEKTS